MKGRVRQQIKQSLAIYVSKGKGAICRACDDEAVSKVRDSLFLFGYMKEKIFAQVILRRFKNFFETRSLCGSPKSEWSDGEWSGEYRLGHSEELTSTGRTVQNFCVAWQ